LINSNDKDPFAALYQNGKLYISRASEFIENNTGSKKPDKLINALRKITGEHNIDNTDAICVTTGPGSFTGIRVGLSLAKGLAFGLNKKLIPVNNFALTLNRITKISPEKKYCVLIPAKIPEYYYSVIRNEDQILTGCIEIENLSKIIENDAVIAGDFDDETSIKHPYFEVINVKNLKN
jgi:tRNA threonylcarbamoyl adenosine modification protein YeaZ